MNNVLSFKLQTMCEAGLDEFKQGGLLCQSSDSLRDACICKGQFTQNESLLVSFQTYTFFFLFCNTNRAIFHSVQSVLFHAVKAHSD